MKSPRHCSTPAILLIAVVFFIGMIGAASAADSNPHPLFQKAPEGPTVDSRGPSPSGYNYYVIESWDGDRLWSNASGNWDIENSTGRGMSGIWGVDGEDIFIAGSWNGDVFHKHNGTWTPEPMPIGINHMGDVWGFARDNVFAVGSEDQEGITNLFQYDGTNWTEVANLSNSAAYRALWGASDQDLYMVGYGGDIAHFDGETLTPMASPATSTLQAIWGTSSHNIYAVGNNSQLLHFDGTTWTQEDIPPSEAALLGVWGTSADNVYVTGSNVVHHFDGQDWTEVEGLPESSDFWDVFGTSPNDIYIVGWSGLILHFDGETWTTEASGSGNSYTHIWGGLMANGDQNWASDWGEPIDDSVGFNSSVYQIAEYAGQQAFCGEFTTVDGVDISSMAFWNGVSFAPLYASTGPNDSVHDLEMFDGDLYCAGRFTEIDGTPINCVAMWNGTSWAQLGAGLPAPGGGALGMGAWDLIVFEDELYVVGDPNVTAKWDGTSWTPLTIDGGDDGSLFAATVHDGDLYAGGIGFSNGAVKMLTGTTWNTIDATLSGDVYTLLSKNGSLYVGGSFQVPGTTEPEDNNLGIWTGTSWLSAGTLITPYVLCLKDHPDGVFVGGQFDRINGVLHGGAAIWEGGDIWTPMGSGTDYLIWDAALDGRNMSVCGFFARAGNHRAGGAARWEFEELAIPDAPSSGPATAGQDYTVEINIAGDPGANPVYLHYRLRDDDPYSTALMTASSTKDGVFEATVPGNFFEELGFQFFVAAGGSDEPVYFPDSAPAEPAYTGVALANESLGVSVANQYILMGIPFVSDQDLGGILTDALGSYDKSKWRCGRWDPTSGDYDEFPAVEAVLPGRAYWLIQKDPVEIPATGITTSTVGNVVLTLEPGWNMIANPYNFIINWSDVVLGPNVENRLVARSGGGYTDVTQMNPWQGYWVRNVGLNATTITIPPIPAPPITKESETPVVEKSATWEIALSAVKGDRFDTGNIAGISSEAQPGIDGTDYFEPPALPGDVSLFFEVEDGQQVQSLSRDMRGEFTNGESWDLVLRYDGGGTVELDITGCQDVPLEHGLVLITANQTYDLRQATHLPIAVGSSGEMRLRLAVGDPIFVDEQEQSLPRPYALRQVYPNPFNPMTTVSFTLPRSGQVFIDVYDVRGHLIQNLVDDQYEAGLHQVNWLGQDNNGQSVAAGVYFCRMRSGDFVQNQKMTLVK